MDRSVVKLVVTGAGYSCLGGLVTGSSMTVVVLRSQGGDWTRCQSMGQSLAVERGLGVDPCGRVAGASM
jgi:hypothetical protein